MPVELKTFTENNYPVLSDNDKLILLIFVTEDCDLCNQFKELLSKKLSLADIDEIFLIDSDEHPELDKKYSIAYNPTVVLTYDNKVIYSGLGSVPHHIDQLIEKISTFTKPDGVN